MDPSSRPSAIRRTLRALKGPGLCLLFIAGYFLAPRDLRRQFADSFVAILGLSTALSGSLGSALTITLMSVLCVMLDYLQAPYGTFTEHVIRMATIALAFPFGFWLVQSGKHRAEHSARLQAERDAAVAHARQLESEVERRLAELRQTEAQQAELERFRELDRLKGMFVNAVSHELRTPLSTIVGYIEFMEDGIGGTLSSIQRDYVQQIRRSSKQLERLVDDLLDFARLEAGTFKLNLWPADLSDKTRQVADSLRPMVLEAKQTLEVEVPDEPVLAKVDAQRIDQVLLNLLSNALKFTPVGGHIRLRMVLEGETATWAVTDTGIGICPTQQDKLFRPYSRIETGLGVKGTGLGLSICKAIIEAHGGEIGVESAQGKGSTFWFRLPLQAVPQPVEAPELAPQAL